MNLKGKLEQLKKSKKEIGFINPGGNLMKGKIEEVGEDFVTVQINDKIYGKPFTLLIPFQSLVLKIETKGE